MTQEYENIQLSFQNCDLVEVKLEKHEVMKRILIELVKEPKDQTDQRVGNLGSKMGHG